VPLCEGTPQGILCKIDAERKLEFCVFGVLYQEPQPRLPSTSDKNPKILFSVIHPLSLSMAWPSLRWCVYTMLRVKFWDRSGLSTIRPLPSSILRTHGVILKPRRGRWGLALVVEEAEAVDPRELGVVKGFPNFSRGKEGFLQWNNSNSTCLALAWSRSLLVSGAVSITGKRGKEYNGNSFTHPLNSDISSPCPWSYTLYILFCWILKTYQSWMHCSINSILWNNQISLAVVAFSPKPE